MGTHHDQLPLNNSRPLIMHIDLNSCFAIIEQQANPLYRRKPVAVAAYDTPRGMVIASSYEAKAKGIKLGVNVGQARLIDPEVIVLMPDPAKYRYAHSLFRQVLEEYSSELHAKSIDEFVLDFSGSPTIRDGRDLMDVGYEIKHKIKDKVGSYVTVNVGIGTNRFWAKTAAGLNKPDGLDMMSAENALKIYGQMELTDLTGINHRYQARLNQNCIFKPLQFYEATEQYLHKQVFKSIVGRQW
jgi:DNA polymerase-4